MLSGWLDEKSKQTKRSCAYDFNLYDLPGK